MSGFKGNQLVSLWGGGSEQLQNITKGTLVTAVHLSGTDFSEISSTNWTGSSLSEIQITSASVVFNTSGSTAEEFAVFNDSLSVGYGKKILVKDSTNTYRFKSSQDLQVGSDYLIKYESGSLSEELLEDAYTDTNSEILHKIGIEPDDVYILNGYIVHNSTCYWLLNACDPYCSNAYDSNSTSQYYGIDNWCACGDTVTMDDGCCYQVLEFGRIDDVPPGYNSGGNIDSNVQSCFGGGCGACPSVTLIHQQVQPALKVQKV